MEDLFAQKDVGVTWCFGPSHLCVGSFTFIKGLLCVQMEEAEMRSWIEKLQVRLQTCSLDSQQLKTVLESLVMKKQSLCEMLQYWNGRSGVLPASLNILMGGGRRMYVYIYYIIFVCWLVCNRAAKLFFISVVLTLSPLSLSDCRTFFSRRKARSVSLSLQAQAGTGRPPMMTARWVTSPAVVTCNLTLLSAVVLCHSFRFRVCFNELLNVQHRRTVLPAEHQDGIKVR